MFKVLHNRNFALLWMGQLISIIGDWVLIAALPFFVYDLTGSALAREPRNEYRNHEGRIYNYGVKMM